MPLFGDVLSDVLPWLRLAKPVQRSAFSSVTESAIHDLLVHHLGAHPGEPATACLMRIGFSAEQVASLSGFVTACEVTLAAARQAEARADERLALAMRNSGMGLWEWDLASQSICVDANWKQMLGFDADEIGDDFAFWRQRIQPDDLASFTDALRQHLKGTLDYFDVVFRSRARDEGLRWIRARGRAFAPNASGRWTRLIGIYYDVTEMQSAEDALREARDAAEAASRAKSDFLANMSHEIRTPMNGVIGMTELALDTPLDAEQRDYLNNVKASGEALLTILNDILDFSKIEAGKMELESIDFSARSVVSETIKTLALRAQQKGLELVYEIAPEVPAVMRGDPGRIRQILLNLVGNAIKFTENGQVCIALRTLDKDDQTVTLAADVSDSGIGIAADKLAAVFDAFSQADTSTTRKFGGTGLGLAICRRLVSLMSGELSATSVIGEGSTFTFTMKLPIVVQGGQASSRFLAGKRVLVAETNAKVGDALDRLLTGWGAHCAMAATPDALLQALRQAEETADPFDFLMLDAAMPAPGGFALVETFRTETGWLDRIVMMMTTQSQRNVSGRCKQLGLHSRLVKPFSPEDVSEVLLSAQQGDVADTGDEFAFDPELTLTRLAKARDDSLNILLVEDNPINQMVATKMLEKAGHRITLASNGQEALEQLDGKTFDVVLMDVQMPVMGGIEAAQAFRSREARRSWAMGAGSFNAVPIIAMTAHAMASDRQRCLAAGMDDYVTKPITPRELFAAIDRVCGEASAQADDAESSLLEGMHSIGQSSTLDLNQTLELLDGDEDALKQLVKIFFNDFGANLQKLKSAAADNDCKTLAALAHSVKGSVGVFNAAPALAAADAVEQAARHDNIEAAREALPGLLDTLNRLATALRQTAFSRA